MADISKINVNSTNYNIKDATARNAMVYEKSASGSLVSFNDGGDNIPLKSLIANITAVQSGSGTPSPSNVRAISGWSGCELSVNSVVTTIPFGQTVYGGTLDVTKGLLTDLYRYDLFDGSSDENWTLFSEDTNFLTFRVTLSSTILSYSHSGNGIYNWAEYGRVATSGKVICRGNEGSDSKYFYVIISKSLSLGITDLTTFETYLSNNNFQALNKLSTPVTYQLTPEQVSTLLGLNNIFADTGDISLSYFTQNANAINDIAESNTRTALNTDVPKTDLTDIFVTGTKNNTGATITDGTYFYVNGQLALCKQAIGANNPLTLGTNYELVTAGALNKLMSNINTSLTVATAGTVTVPTGIDISITRSKIIKFNGIKFINAVIKANSNINGNNDILTLPSGYTGIAEQQSLIVTTSTGGSILAYIVGNGSSIRTTQTSNLVSGTTYYINGWYL